MLHLTPSWRLRERAMDALLGLGCWAARGWAEQEKAGRAPSNGGASDARTKRREDKSGSARLGVGGLESAVPRYACCAGAGPEKGRGIPGPSTEGLAGRRRGRWFGEARDPLGVMERLDGGSAPPVGGPGDQ